MTEEHKNLEDLIHRARSGEEQALVELFALYRERLRAMVHLRLDRRLQGRLDPSDVLQEGYITYARRVSDYIEEPSMPFFLWLRSLIGQTIVDLHRKHLGAQMRDAGQEVSLYRGGLPQASSASLANHLLGRLTTPSLAIERAELRVQVQEALNGMDPIDREVLALRHFEMLTNEETARVLGLRKSAASNRYIRALQRLKAILTTSAGNPP